MEKLNKINSPESVLDELNKKQRKFIKRAIKDLSKALGVSRDAFAVVKKDSAPDSVEPEIVDTSDGKPWVEARSPLPARFIIRYASLAALETSKVDEVCERGIMVGAKKPKGDKTGREGWATPVYLSYVEGPDTEKRTNVPTVDVPLDI